MPNVVFWTSVARKTLTLGQRFLPPLHKLLCVHHVWRNARRLAAANRAARMLKCQVKPCSCKAARRRAEEIPSNHLGIRNILIGAPAPRRPVSKAWLDLQPGKPSGPGNAFAHARLPSNCTGLPTKPSSSRLLIDQQHKF